MGRRKTLLKFEAGVRLQRIEHLRPAKGRAVVLGLSTMRSNQPRTFADETAAEDAFDVEIFASLAEPIIIDRQRRGLLG